MRYIYVLVVLLTINSSYAFSDTFDKLFIASGKDIRLNANVESFHTNDKVVLSNFMDETGRNSLSITLQKVHTSYIDPTIATVSRFRGSVETDKGSCVYLTVIDKYISVKVIKGNGVEYNILPSQSEQNNTYLLMNKEDKVMNTPTLCQAIEPQDVMKFKTKGNANKTLANKTLQLNIALDVCKEWYLWKFNGDTTRIKNYILTMYSMVSFIYEKEMNISLYITWLKLRTNTDPYNSGGDASNWGGMPRTVLDAMPDYWKKNNLTVKADLVHAVSVGGRGGVANYDGLSKGIHDGNTWGPYAAISITGDSKFTGDPTTFFDYDVHTVAHEMGHNLNCPHTHSCSWNPPIDTCVVYDGGNDGCPASGSKRICTPATQTSIMSYCREINNWISKMTFLNQPATLIRKYAESYLKEINIDETKPAIPTLVNPPSNAKLIPLNAGFKWLKNDIALRYHLQVSKDFQFTTILQDTIINLDTLPFYGLKGTTNYYWRVASINHSGEGEFTNVWQFKTGYTTPDTPTLLNPSTFSIITTDSVRFVWNNVGEDIIHYWIQIADNDNYDNPVISDSSLTDTSYIFRKFITDQVYYWHVSAKNGGLWGDFSKDGNFLTKQFIKPITLISPINHFTTANKAIKLVWKEITNDDFKGYWLEIASDSLMKSIVFLDSALVDSFYFTNALQSGSYYWRVRGSNDAGWGEFSEIRQFTLGATDVNESLLSYEELQLVCSPNPTSNYMLISFNQPSTTAVEITLRNMLGQDIATIFRNSELPIGKHSIDMKCEGIPNGIYFIRVEAGNRRATLPIVIAR